MKIEAWLKEAKEQVSALDAELLLVWALGAKEDAEEVRGADGRVLGEGEAAGGASEAEGRATPGESGLTLDRSYLVAHGEEELSAETLAKLEVALERRARGEPLAYIVGEKEFYGRNFRVDSRVLIPRPETEVLVDLVRERVQGAARDSRRFAIDFATVSRQRQMASRQEASAGRILEIGTGSGCLAVTLALELPEAEVVATDVSAEALMVARENAERLGVAARVGERRSGAPARSDVGARVEFRQADLLAGLAGEFEVLVANLPYVDANWEWLDRKSLDYEPAGALYSERNGLAHYARLLAQLGAAKAKVRARWLVLEADPCQQEELARLAVAQGWRLAEKRGFGMVLGQA